jgi:hypothetical protein
MHAFFLIALNPLQACKRLSSALPAKKLISARFPDEPMAWLLQLLLHGQTVIKHRKINIPRKQTP